MAKERKLTEQEQQRKVEFEKFTQNLISQGYKRKELTMTTLYANLMSLFMLPIVVVFGIIFIVLNPGASTELTVIEWGIVWIAFIVLIVVHELVHGLTWSRFTKKGWKSISFGFIWKYFTPYCTCDEPLKKGEYIIGALMPTLILGFLPAVVSILVGSVVILIISILLIIGGGGDFAVIFKILGYKTNANEILYIDHPYEVGGIVFER